ncbi:MAG: hypothetical protein KAU38_15115 [Desulfobacterales bacterium]|nr:hypothetical protein [Desulfobacterales bacterium]
MSIFDMICSFADRMWRDMLHFYGIEDSNIGEHEISGIVIEFYSTINAI